MQQILCKCGKFILVDDNDFACLKLAKWSCAGTNAVRATSSLYNTRRIHNVIMGVTPFGMVVDHINSDIHDNRKENLQFITQAQNVKKARMKNTNTSGYKGVTYHKARKKWQAGLCLCGKYLHGGFFTDIKEAAKKYNEMALHYFGKQAPLNDIK